MSAVDTSFFRNSGSKSNEQADVPALENPFQVAANYETTCALDKNGVKCWGYSSDTYDLSKFKKPVQLSMGFFNYCVIDDEGVKCWDHFYGKPVSVPKLNNPTQISVSGHICVIERDGLKCWGNNTFGQTDVPKLNKPYFVSTGHGFTCVLDQDGEKCWGRDNNGETDSPSGIVGVIPPCNPTVAALMDGGYICRTSLGAVFKKISKVDEYKDCWKDGYGSHGVIWCSNADARYSYYAAIEKGCELPSISTVEDAMNHGISEIISDDKLCWSGTKINPVDPDPAPSEGLVYSLFGSTFVQPLTKRYGIRCVF